MNHFENSLRFFRSRNLPTVKWHRQMSVVGTASYIRRRRDLFEANHTVGASLNGRYAHLNASQ